MDGSAQLVQPSDVGIREQSPAVGRHPEHELRAPAHGLFVDRGQALEAFQGGLVARMPEPMQLAQRSVCLDGAPAQIAMTIDDIPVLIIDAS